MNKNIEAAAKKAESIKVNSKAELKQIRDALVDIGKIISACETRMNSATVVNDFDSYADAKAEKAKAEDRAEMLRKRYDSLTKENGISFEDCQAFWNSVKVEQQKALDKCMEQLAPVIKQARDICSEAMEIIGKGNEALTTWHRTCRQFSAEDVPTRDESANVFFNNYVLFKDETLIYINNILNYDTMHKLTGTEKAKPENKLFFG